jgi:hypothetical protein
VNEPDVEDYKDIYRVNAAADPDPLEDSIKMYPVNVNGVLDFQFIVNAIL